jgi:hypothetical protein
MVNMEMEMGMRAQQLVRGMVNKEMEMDQGYGQHGDGDGHESSTVGDGYGQEMEMDQGYGQQLVRGMVNREGGDGDGSRVWSTWRRRWT